MANVITITNQFPLIKRLLHSDRLRYNDNLKEGQAANLIANARVVITTTNDETTSFPFSVHGWMHKIKRLRYRSPDFGESIWKFNLKRSPSMWEQAIHYYTLFYYILLVFNTLFHVYIFICASSFSLRNFDNYPPLRVATSQFTSRFTSSRLHSSNFAFYPLPCPSVSISKYIVRGWPDRSYINANAIRLDRPFLTHYHLYRRAQ